jgi:RND family efflux transporter MFP subunit
MAQSSIVVQAREVDLGFPVEATVEAVRQATVAAQIAGRVLEVRVDAGQRVKQGELLMRLDAREAAGSDAAARANLAQASAAYERSKNLHAQKFISQAALDQAQAEYLAAQEQTAAAIAHAGQAATTKSFTTITAPYAGIVAATEVEVGDMAMPGRPLLTLFDARELRVAATLPQAVLAQARLDAAVTVEIPTLGRTLTARRVTVLPVADTRTHTTHVRLDLPEAEGLLPGQYARAQFVTVRTRLLAIPETALLRRSEVTAAYVLDRSGAARLRQVRVGEPVGEGLVEVLAGLSAGERVSLEPVRSGIEASRGTDPRS